MKMEPWRIAVLVALAALIAAAIYFTAPSMDGIGSTR
jgi:hypothetical protein